MSTELSTELSQAIKHSLKKQQRHNNKDSSSIQHIDNQLSLNCQKFFTQQIEFTSPRTPDTYLEQLKEKYHPINSLVMDSPQTQTTPTISSNSDIPKPRKILFSSENIQIKWAKPHSIGSGLSNLGNTCFLNSVLQCLTYTPPLYNYLTSEDHKISCTHQGFCSMCTLHAHVIRVFKSEGVVKPLPIVHNLKVFAKHLRFGRQEDAHEFLRYFIDSLQKVCLHGHSPKLDVYTKCTTVIHQIFGGYHRSQVKCLKCHKTSNTFDPLLDISLDIKGCPTLIQALKMSIKPDVLDNENKYACPFCKELTQAKKQFTIHKLPNVLTIQLKRFEYNTLFGGKINKTVQYNEYLNMRPFMSDTQGPKEWYRLYAVLVHFGFSCNSGHYYCYVRNSNNTWYSMNDNLVSQVSVKTVLSQEAYLLFYVKDDEYCPSLPSPSTPLVSSSTQNNKTTPKIQNSNSFGVPVKRTPQIIDDTTTKPNITKPTGVVNPSPKVDVPQPPSSHLPSSHPPSSHPPLPSPSLPPSHPPSFHPPSHPPSLTLSPSSSLLTNNNNKTITPYNNNKTSLELSTTPTANSSAVVTPSLSTTPNLKSNLTPSSIDTPTKTTPHKFTPRSVQKLTKKEPQVAYVSPIPPLKPVARVPPSPHVTQNVAISPPDNKKGRDQTPPISTSRWNVSERSVVMYGPSLPPDLVQGTSPNWTVTSIGKDKKKEIKNDKNTSFSDDDNNENPLTDNFKKDDLKKDDLRKDDFKKDDLRKDDLKKDDFKNDKLEIKNDRKMTVCNSDRNRRENERKEKVTKNKREDGHKKEDKFTSNSSSKKHHHHRSSSNYVSKVSNSDNSNIKRKHCDSKDRHSFSSKRHRRDSSTSSTTDREDEEERKRRDRHNKKRKHKKHRHTSSSPQTKHRNYSSSSNYSEDNNDKRYRRRHSSPGRSYKRQPSPDRHYYRKSLGHEEKRSRDKKSRRDKHDEKRRLSPTNDNTPIAQKSKKVVPVIRWDQLPPPSTATLPSTPGQTTLNNNKAVFDEFDKSDQLGNKVKTWSGEKNSVDSSFNKEDTRRKKGRDDWDREIDQGKVKKMKKQSNDWDTKNRFQAYQNKKNYKKF